MRLLALLLLSLPTPATPLPLPAPAPPVPLSPHLQSLLPSLAAAHRSDVSLSEARFYHGPATPRPAPAWRSFPFPSPASADVDSRAPPPFGRGDLARASQEPLFTLAECAAVVSEAEASRSWRGAAPHASYAEAGGASFLPLRELPGSLAWLNGRALPEVLLPAVAAAFPFLEPEQLRVSAASVVKYDARAGASSLGVHRDGPLVAATVSLNGFEEYDGGGTYIEALDRALRLDAGHLLLHPAAVRHGGAATTRGGRYILVVWLFSAALPMPRHYALRRAGGLLAAALRAAPGGPFRQEALAAAAAAFGDALKLGAGEEGEAAHLGRGQALLELGRGGEAVPFFEAALERAPDNRLAKQLLLRANE
ncbi:hypothetical protein TeGR_g12799 [Tetraparma gracilis]|uniref:Fe2OG dioxygenase domain-containing protein n=1 Tax=Tetraparma gracilis TaxID=2962635 RepID=A0ABQ6N1S1_9STRA|nr:hypothetical protein TeGR_g12799 [Tetraparma gracilis]